MSTEIPSRIDWAEREEIDQLVPLLTALYVHEAPSRIPVTTADAKRHAERLLAPETPHRLAIAWSDDSKAIGLAAAAQFVSISNPQPEVQVQMELKELFVLPAYRSHGVGDALIHWLEAEARAAGVCRIDWHVKESNTRGIAFYERFGGRVVSDRLSMRKTLQPGAT